MTPIRAVHLIVLTALASSPLACNDVGDNDCDGVAE